MRLGTSGDGDEALVCRELVLEVAEGVDWEESRGGRGRKLQEPGARWETRVKISEMRRCWTLVSWECCVSEGTCS
jgi:hypothetical protein